ncbi:MAG: gamma-glutamylcyclotransferase [Rhodospirillales bacterium]|nr:gamma-glutamylcyclotransferase [Rhodospirillales bacterium]
MDPAVLAAVIGRRPGTDLRRRASIEGYRRVYRDGAAYPVLIPAAGERVSGLLVEGLNDRDRRRLDAFEGGDYVARTVPVRTDRGEVRAWMFVPRPGVPATSAPWSLDDWRRRHRRRYLERVIRTRRPL